MSKKIITIIGNIGSGKSSALPIVADHLKAHRIDADNLFQTTDPFAKVYLDDMRRWAFTNELWLTVHRVKLISEELKKVNKMIYLIDSGLLMSWVYTYSHYAAERLTQAEWDFYCEMHDALSSELLTNSAVIYLDYSSETLMQRIKKRGRTYELQHYTREYLEELQIGLDQLIKMLASKKIAVLRISENDVKDFEASDEDRVAMTSMIERF